MIRKSTDIALTLGDQKESYNSLLLNIDKYAQLIEGDQDTRIAIFSENRFEWVYAFYAIWKNNAVPVTVDFMSKPNEIAYILKDCAPKYVFTSKDNLDFLKTAIDLIDHTPEIIVFDEIEDDLPNSEPDDFSDFPDENDACIIYSSGTTGNPKGVILTHKNIKININAVSVDDPIVTKKTVILAMLPFHHVLPLVGCVLCPLQVGAKIAITPSLDPVDIVKTLQDNGVTILISVPRFYTMLFKGIKAKIEQKFVAKLLFNIADRLQSKTFSRLIFKAIHEKFGGHLEIMLTGGAAIDKSVEKGFHTLGFEIISGYGMTETAPLITFPRPGNGRIGSVGKALKTNEVKIASDGEVITRGPNVMKGYFNLPDKTADTVINGWMHTGDLGYIDDEGYLFLTGRKKEIIVLPNGKNINPVNIEFEILKMSNCINEIGVFMHEDILQMVCSPDEKHTQEAGITDFKKFIQDDIVTKYNEKVAPYKQIKKITVVKVELPKTRLDKIKRFKLKDLVPTLSDKSKSIVEPSFQEYSVIRDFINQQMEKKIYPGDHLEFDLGMDSLDKVSLQTFIKKSFDVDIQEIHLKENPTVRKLSEFIRKNSKKIKTEAVNLSDVFKEKVHVKLPKSWATHVILRNIGRFFLKLMFNIRINDINKLPHAPYIMAPNHQSFVDGMLVVSDLSTKQLRNTFFFGKAKHIRNWFIKFLAKTSNVIIVDINSDLKGSLQQLAAAIREGKNVIIFPEGTRSYDGSLENFKKTFAILAKEMNVPVVPVVIDGAYKALPRDKHFPKFGTRINVTYLDAIIPKGKETEDIRDEVKQRIQEKLEK